MPQEVERGEVTAGKMRSRWRNSEISATTRARILVCAPYIGDSLRSNDSRLPRFPPPHPGPRISNALRGCSSPGCLSPGLKPGCYRLYRAGSRSPVACSR